MTSPNTPPRQNNIITKPTKSTSPYWLHQGTKAQLLRPLSTLFRGISKIRHWWLYHVKKPWNAPIPVVIIGNLTAGGAGKTPTTIALIEHLKKAGHFPAVISRGYGRVSTASCLEVQPHSTPQDVGDEPLLIQQQTQAPVFVGAKRIQTVQSLLAAYPQTSVILSDDGLQHYALGRDIEIAVFDERGAGNGWLIPAGPLREPLSRTQSVDLILYNANHPPLPISGYMAHRKLGGYIPLKEWLQTSAPQRQWQPMRALAQQQNKQGICISALAGIGHPDRFFNMLVDENITLTQTCALPDHYDFQHNPFENMEASIILITEKDAAKCQTYATDPRIYVVGLSYIPEPEFFEHFDALLDKAIQKKKSLLC